MKLSLIVAMSNNHVIGVNNRLPWHLTADLKRFKSLTLGKPILMGRKTHESIGRPLPGRRNIILTAEMRYQATGCEVVHSPEEALRAAGESDELMVIGGSSLYERFLPEADRLYLTLIDGDFAGDTFFPAIEMSDWVETHRQDVNDDPTVEFSYHFLVLERRRSGKLRAFKTPEGI